MSLTSMQGTLVAAAASGDVASVEELLKDGVDPNGTTEDGKTALDVAAMQKIKNVLIAHGGKRGSNSSKGYFARLFHRLFG